jgi:DNA-binding NtrC family response regulator
MESALKSGAQKFLGKPWQVNEVHLILEKAEALWNLRHAGQNNRKTVWIGNSAASQDLKRTLSRLKGETTPVLVEGETGTGKEVVARILHEQEPARPFIAINISAIPDNLFESEMFGHIKGAFTGADQNKMGLIEAAQGGDLFLDEIEEFPLIHQAKLLRFLESGEIRKVGAKDSFKVQTRLIAASNKPIESLVKAGSFREDLFFRLASTRIQLTPLRQRLDDLNELSHFFLELQKPRQNKKWTEDGLEALQAYSWPGNARELKRLCEQLALTSPLPIIRAEDVKPWLSPRSVSSPTMNVDYSLGLTQIVENFEKQILENYLKSEPDVEKAAVALQISKSNLYKKIKDYSIKLKGDH